MTTLDFLERADDRLADLENYLHDEEGDSLSKARGDLNQVRKQLMIQKKYELRKCSSDGDSKSTIVNEAFENIDPAAKDRVKEKTDRIDNIVRLNKLKEMIYINKLHGNKLKHDVAFQLIDEIRETL